MEIQLLSNTFTIKHNEIEFIFNRDKRTLLTIALKGYDLSVLAERMESDLAEIKGCTDKQGKAFKPSDFKLFPNEIYTAVFGQYFQNIKNELLSKSQEIANDSIKKKSVKK
jgi:hypothetical protein